MKATTICLNPVASLLPGKADVSKVAINFFPQKFITCAAAKGILYVLTFNFRSVVIGLTAIAVPTGCVGRYGIDVRPLLTRMPVDKQKI